MGIVGGGLAGLAAGCALADAGYKVTLFERKPYLGGRASSYEHPGTGEVVDNCQHVLLGCCTNLLDLYRRLGVEDRIRWYDQLTFIEPGGRRGTIEPSQFPAPLHTLPAFLKFPLLSARDKFTIALAMVSLTEGLPHDDGDSFLQWLRRHRQTQRAIDRFWSPVLVSSLNEELSDVSIPYGAMVFRDAFLKSAEAGRMGVPSVPLSQLYGVAANYIRERGGEVLLRAPVESIGAAGERAWATVALPGSREGRQCEFDYLISAVPFQVLRKLLSEAMQSDALREDFANLRTSPITGIHLWFDREITELEHAILLDRTIQWMFQKSKILEAKILEAKIPEAKTLESKFLASRTLDESCRDERGRDERRSSDIEAAGVEVARAAAAGLEASGRETPGSYLELVVSSSKSLVDKSRQEILDLALAELAEFFPEARNARLLKATVIKELNATFSPSPGSDHYRPPQAGPWRRLLLSGDWTATGWPATMEGAVRAGYAAAEALASARGERRRFLVPDLAPQGLMPLFGKGR